mmetsp:Transcript_44761/g.129378  ORF Transcript_44761/g.129378 Transcript_44761/m.129378 type:complete len:230 (+) Transcript_44761:214-903(+)
MSGHGRGALGAWLLLRLDALCVQVQQPAQVSGRPSRRDLRRWPRGCGMCTLQPGHEAEHRRPLRALWRSGHVAFRRGMRVRRPRSRVSLHHVRAQRPVPANLRLLARRDIHRLVARHIAAVEHHRLAEHLVPRALASLHAGYEVVRFRFRGVAVCELHRQAIGVGPLHLERLGHLRLCSVNCGFSHRHCACPAQFPLQGAEVRVDLALGSLGLGVLHIGHRYYSSAIPV